MDKQGLQHRLELKELEINALLEITQAINNNVPEEALYKIFKFTVISNLKFTKLCLFVRDGHWSGKVSFGTTTDYTLVFPDALFTELTTIKRVKELTTSGPFSEFELVIPIAHRGTIISLLFVGGVEEIFSTSSNDERLGFLVYTAEGDSMGTMGGVVRFAQRGILEGLLDRMLESVAWCPQAR